MNSLDTRLVADDWLHKPDVLGSPNRVLTAHTEWLLGVRLRHFSTTCALDIYEGWCLGLSGCHSSVAEHWLHKPVVLASILSSWYGMDLAIQISEGKAEGGQCNSCKWMFRIGTPHDFGAWREFMRETSVEKERL